MSVVTVYQENDHVYEIKPGNDIEYGHKLASGVARLRRNRKEPVMEYIGENHTAKNCIGRSKGKFHNRRMEFVPHPGG